MSPQDKCQFNDRTFCLTGLEVENVGKGWGFTKNNLTGIMQEQTSV